MSAFNVLRTSALSFVIVISTLSGLAHGAPHAVHDAYSEAIKDRPGTATEPFGLPTSTLADGPLRAKWLTVERAIAAEAEVIAGCAGDPGHCASQPALRFLEIVKMASSREGLARFGEINRAFNLAIRPVSDRAQYGVEDYWQSPLATLAAGAGDCEDYAIAKLVALRAAGVAAEDVRLLIIRETATGDDHAVVAARFEGQWRVLDNRTFIMLEDSDFDKYRPLFAIDAEGAKRFEQPMFANAAQVTQARPAEIAQYEAAAGPGTSETALSMDSSAFDEFCQTLAM